MPSSQIYISSYCMACNIVLELECEVEDGETGLWRLAVTGTRAARLFCTGPRIAFALLLHKYPTQASIAKVWVCPVVVGERLGARGLEEA